MVVDQLVSGILANAEDLRNLRDGQYIGVIFQRRKQPPLKRCVGIIPQQFENVVNASQKSVVGFRLAYLYIGVLFFQGDVADEIYRGEACDFVGVSAREHEGISIQIIQHVGNG